MRTTELQHRIDAQIELQEKLSLEVSFEESLVRLTEEHQDMESRQLEIWSTFLVERDLLALGAVVAMMDVRDSRREASRYDVAS